MRYHIYSEPSEWTIEAYHGIGYGATFQEACDELFTRKNVMRRPFAPKDTNYNPKKLTYWGCKLFGDEVK